MCGEKVFEVSLWRDEALRDLYAGDEVVITHLRPCILNDGRGKFHSSTYTSVKVHNAQQIHLLWPYNMHFGAVTVN